MTEKVLAPMHVQEQILAQLNTAMAQHRAGAWAAAERGYRDVLAVVPDLVDAAHLLGLALADQQRWDEAESWLQRAAAQAPPPARPTMLTNLARCLTMAGQPARAIAVWAELAAIRPDDVDTQRQYAGVLRDGGEIDAALAIYRQMLTRWPADTGALNNLAVILTQRGDGEEAATLLRRLLSQVPGHAVVWDNLGSALRVSGKLEAAVEAHKQALDRDAGYVPAWFNRGLAQRDLFLVDGANADFEQVLALDPAHDQARHLLVDGHLDRYRVQAATEVLDAGGASFQASARTVIQRARIAVLMDDLEAAFTLLQQPTDSGRSDLVFERLELALHWGRDDQLALIEQVLPTLTNSPNKARALLMRLRLGQGRIEEADVILADMIASVTNDADRRATAFAAQSAYRPDLAAQLFDQLLADPNPDPNDVAEAAIAALACGRFADGWRWFDAALGRGKVSRGPDRGRYLELSRWDPDADPTPAEPVFLWSEQGIGDQIQFLSILPELTQAGLNLWVETNDRLVPLLQRSYPTVTALPQVLENGSKAVAAGVRAQAPMVAALGARRPDQASFAAQPTAFLQADPALTARLKQRYRPEGEGAAPLVVGIGWRGGGRHTRKGRVAALEHWGPIFTVPGVRFVSVQYGDVAADLASAQDQLGVQIIHDTEIDPLVSMDEAAAQLAATDLVISTTNAGVHLAGALGVPCWTMIPFAPDWRWTMGVDGSLWYPTMRVFRQPRPGDWHQVIKQLADQLDDVVATRRDLSIPRASL